LEKRAVSTIPARKDSGGSDNQEFLIDLDTIERDLNKFEQVKSAASPGPWVRGVFHEMCLKHPDGAHPGYDDPTDPCETQQVLFDSGQSASYVSTPDHTLLVGWDEEGAILSEADARFLVAARNLPIEDYCRRLINEVRRLRK
jgi:hypothetical protein